MRTVLQTIVLIAVLFALALVIDQFAPLHQLTLYLVSHPRPYTFITIGISLLGWALMILAWTYGSWLRGRPMDKNEINSFMGSGVGRTVGSGRFRGQARGREYQAGTGLAEIKSALRTGAAWREPGWRPILLGLLALPLIIYGMFGFLFVVGSPLVKVICAGAMIYATLMTIRGFWRA